MDWVKLTPEEQADWLSKQLDELGRIRLQVWSMEYTMSEMLEQLKEKRRKHNTRSKGAGEGSPASFFAALALITESSRRQRAKGCCAGLAPACRAPLILLYWPGG